MLAPDQKFSHVLIPLISQCKIGVKLIKHGGHRTEVALMPWQLMQANQNKACKCHWVKSGNLRTINH